MDNSVTCSFENNITKSQRCANDECSILKCSNANESNCDSFSLNNTPSNENETIGAAKLCHEEHEESNDKIRRCLQKILIKLLSAKVVLERLPDDITSDDTCNISQVDNKIENYEKESKNLIKRFCRKCCKYYKTTSTRCRKCKTHLIYECKRCNRQFKQFHGAHYHVKSRCNFKGYNYNCPQCDYRTVCNDTFQRHLRTKNHVLKTNLQKLKSHCCLKCNKRFENLYSLNIHRQDCDISKNIAHEDVGKTKKELKLHKCLKCHKQFKYKVSYTMHARRCGELKHTDKKETEQGSMLKSQLSNDNLSDTIKMIRMATRYCEKCKQPVATEMIGKNRTQPTCRDCGSVLQFQCSKCKRIMLHRQIFLNHEAICKQQNVFKCSKCKFKTFQKYYLSRHYKEVHDYTTIKCPNCNTTLKNKEYLKRHLRTVCQKKKAHAIDRF